MEKIEKKTTSSIKDGMWNYENHLQSWQTELHHQTEIYCCIRMTEENIRGWWQEYPKSWNTSVVFVLRGTRMLHRGTIYHSFGEINWWESEERAKAAVKKVREDCREEEKGVGWWERQLQGKKKWAMQQNSSVALWPQVLCCSNEAILTRSLWLCVLTTFPCCTTSTGHSFIEQSALCLSQSS